MQEADIPCIGWMRGRASRAQQWQCARASRRTATPHLDVSYAHASCHIYHANCPACMQRIYSHEHDAVGPALDACLW